MNIILDILKLFGGIMFIAHWTACLFFSIAKFEAYNDPNTWTQEKGFHDSDFRI